MTVIPGESKEVGEPPYLTPPGFTYQEDFDREEAENAEKGKVQGCNYHGPFCCGNIKFIQRMSSAGLPEEEHAPIHNFVATMGKRGFEYALGALTRAELRTIEQVIKGGALLPRDAANPSNNLQVNQQVNFEEISTWLYTPNSITNLEAGYTGFMKVNVSKFADIGPSAYLAFYCKKHQGRYRIGSFSLKWGSDGKEATYGNANLDKLMEIPSVPKPEYGYSGNGW